MKFQIMNMYFNKNQPEFWDMSDDKRDDSMI